MISNFNARQCNVCYQNGIINSFEKNLIQCNKCKLILYCGNEHQSDDLPYHTEFCTAIHDLTITRNIKHPFDIFGHVKNINDFVTTRIAIGAYLTFKLKRELNLVETAMLHFPKMCKICYEHDNSKLINCLHCGGVSYCCDEHQKSNLAHKLNCQQIKIFYKFLPDNSLSKMYKFKPIKMTEEKKILPKDLVSLVSMFTNEQYKEIPVTLSDYKDFTWISRFSNLATILYTLEVINYEKISNELIIYIVGATKDYYMFTNDISWLFFTWLPNIDNFKLVFIGPELEQDKSFESTTIIKKDGKTKRLTYEFFNIVFDQNFNEYTPDLIMCYNCGFSEYASKNNNLWTNGITQMLKLKNIPIVFTSYTLNESKLDYYYLLQVSLLHSLKFNIVVKGKKNPYKDNRPILNWEVDNEEIFFNNGYIHIVIPF